MRTIKIVLSFAASLFVQTVLAQPGSKTQSIDINSAYKPVLRNAVKINLSGSQLSIDTTLPNLSYKIPSQNLFYAYKPVALRPLALDQDTNLYLGNRNFVKLGYGNFSTPYFSTGLSFGDGRKSILNVMGEYVSSKGTALANQDYSAFNAKALGSYFMPKNELYGSVDVMLNNYYLYGYDHSLYTYSKENVKQAYRDITLKAGFKNTATTETGINYDPNIEVNLFTNANKSKETNALINLPFSKVINDNVSAKIELKADYTNFTSVNLIPNNIALTNTILQISPSVNLYNDQFKLHIGVTPAWDNNTYHILPDAYAEVKVKDKIFSIQAGWIGRLVKNNNRNLTRVNPYLLPIISQINTKETELFGGIKASIASHFNFSAKVGLVSYKNLPLFINDTLTDNKSFKISNESSVQNLRVHGDFGYINQDKFSLTAGLTLNGYTLLTDNARAWHTIPLELTSSLRWWALKTVLFKSDLRVFDGSNYLSKGKISNPIGGGADLSAGVDVKISKMFTVWGMGNNILNSRYERWNNYQVYGANFIGGVLINF